MDNTFNVFISHHGKDDNDVQKLKNRLKDIKKYDVRNGSIDSTKYEPIIPPDKDIIDKLKERIKWAGTFICLIGEKTHTRKWVNFEIRQAYLQGKKIVGIFKHGCKENCTLPNPLKKYGGPVIGWNSLDKLGEIMRGKNIPSETPSSNIRKPIYPVVRIKCNN